VKFESESETYPSLIHHFFLGPGTGYFYFLFLAYYKWVGGLKTRFSLFRRLDSTIKPSGSWQAQGQLELNIVFIYNVTKLYAYMHI